MNSREELTPLRGDLWAALPVILASVATTTRPSALYFTAGSVDGHALTAAGRSGS